MRVEVTTGIETTIDDYVEVITAIAANTKMKFVYGATTFDGMRD